MNNFTRRKILYVELGAHIFPKKQAVKLSMINGSINMHVWLVPFFGHLLGLATKQMVTDIKV